MLHKEVNKSLYVAIQTRTKNNRLFTSGLQSFIRNYQSFLINPVLQEKRNLSMQTWALWETSHILHLPHIFFIALEKKKKQTWPLKQATFSLVIYPNISKTSFLLDHLIYASLDPITDCIVPFEDLPQMIRLYLMYLRFQM